jgi:2-polyprenyl-6-methoxyphenol hydroxylase-like FAD-dependent oxidoreductase
MRVAVFGAGISGLTLAAALRQFAPDVDVDVYERDNALDSRFQGYSLGIKGDTGILALRRLGLFEHLRLSMTPTTNFVFLTLHGGSSPMGSQANRPMG